MHISKDDPLGTYRPFFPAFIDFNDPDYDPDAALDEVYDYCSLDHMRRELWRMYKAAIKDDDEYMSRIERSNLIYFFERMSDLMNAGHLLARATMNRQENADAVKKEEPNA